MLIRPIKVLRLILCDVHAQWQTQVNITRSQRKSVTLLYGFIKNYPLLKLLLYVLLRKAFRRELRPEFGQLAFAQLQQ